MANNFMGESISAITEHVRIHLLSLPCLGIVYPARIELLTDLEGLDGICSRDDVFAGRPVKPPLPITSIDTDWLLDGIRGDEARMRICGSLDFVKA